MTRARRVARGLVALAVAFAVRADDRSHEIVKRACASQLGRNEITLFANGTVRLRSWRGEELSMRLAELGRDELDAFRRRLAGIGFRESAGGSPAGVSGEWVERCELRLELEIGSVRTFRFGRFDTHDLDLATTLRIVDELATLAGERESAGGLAADYVPRVGDLLARSDGVEFEVMGFTVVGEGIELRGRIDPLTIYVTKDDLRRQFVRLVKRSP